MRDPYAERIIDAFALLAARLQMKLDDEFPRFASRLLEVTYPNYAAPTPSMAVARLFPDSADVRVGEGFTLARGTRLASRVAHGEATACEFRTAHDVTLLPFSIEAATLSPTPHDLPRFDRYVEPRAPVRGALRLRLHTSGKAVFADLHALDRLSIHLGGEMQVASHLFELVHTACVGVLAVDPNEPGALRKIVGAAGHEAIAHQGLNADESLLPLAWSGSHGHGLLKEYFACPARFHFFVLDGLRALLSRARCCEIELVILLDRWPERLAALVDASRFCLFCTPVVNLFRTRTDRIELSSSATEFHLAGRRLASRD